MIWREWREICCLNSQNYWAFGLCLSSGIKKKRKHDVSETGFAFVLIWGEGDTYLVESLRNS
jgi:hypothetical protein